MKVLDPDGLFTIYPPLLPRVIWHNIPNWPILVPPEYERPKGGKPSNSSFSKNSFDN